VWLSPEIQAGIQRFGYQCILLYSTLKHKEASMTFGQFVKVFGYVIVVASAIGAALEAIASDKK